MGKRELIALLSLSSWCLKMVGRLFLAVPRGCLQFVIVVFPIHSHLLFFLVEKPAIICQRLTFYNIKQDLEQNVFRLVYIDETWIDTAYTAKRCWQSKDTDGVLSPCNRGQRLIVVHAGS